MSKPAEGKSFELVYAMLTHKKLEIDWKIVAEKFPGNVTPQAARKRWIDLQKKVEKKEAVESSTSSKDEPTSIQKSSSKASKSKEGEQRAQEENGLEKTDGHEEETTVKKGRDSAKSHSISEDIAADLAKQSKGKRKMDAMNTASTLGKLSEKPSSGGSDLEHDVAKTPTLKKTRLRKTPKKVAEGKSKEVEGALIDEKREQEETVGEEQNNEVDIA